MTAGLPQFRPARLVRARFSRDARWRQLAEFFFVDVPRQVTHFLALEVHHSYGRVGVHRIVVGFSGGDNKSTSIEKTVVGAICAFLDFRPIYVIKLSFKDSIECE